MFITAEHLSSPVPIESEPALMQGFIDLIVDRLPITELAEKMLNVSCRYFVDEDTYLTLEIWRSEDDELVFEVVVEDQVRNWLDEKVICERERTYRVNLAEMSAQHEVGWEQHYDENEDAIETDEEEEESERVFNTAHLAEVTWLLERIATNSHSGS